MQIERLGHEALEDLRPLWLQKLARLRADLPTLSPFAPPARSWSAMRGRLAGALAAGGAIIACRRDGAVAGYAALHPDTMPWPATLDVPDRLTRICAFAIADAPGAEDVATCLLGEVSTRAPDIGGTNLMITSAHGDLAEHEFFLRHGFADTALTLTHFGQPWSHLSTAWHGTIEAASPDEAVGMRDLWLPMHHHHQSVAAGLAPFATDTTSWRNVAPVFREAAQAGLLLRAGPAKAPVGVASVSVTPGRVDMAHMWTPGTAMAEIEVMAVAPPMRGMGVGTALLNQVADLLVQQGITHCCVGALAGNSPAIRLYERAGFRPALLDMTRLSDRG